mgnify:CR=1 FL=1
MSEEIVTTEESQGIFGRIGLFYRQVVSELRKVVWPTRKQVVTYTIVVLVFVTVMALFVAGIDLALGRGVLRIFGS